MPLTRHPLLPRDDLRRLGSIPADEGIIHRLESSFALLGGRHGEVVDRCMQRLAQAHPNPSTPFALAPDTTDRLFTVLGVVLARMRQPEALQGALHAFREEAARCGVQGTLYRHFTAALLGALGEVAGAAWTPEFEAEWILALGLLGDQLRASPAAQAGG